MVFVQKIATLVQVVQGFVNSIVAIANGQIGAAVAKVESVLSRLLVLAISFLAGFAGLGSIPSKIKGAIDKIRKPIDKAIDWLIGWIVAGAKKLGKFILQAGTPKDPKKRVDLALGAAVAAAKVLGKRFTKPLLQPALTGIKARYGLTSIEAFQRGPSWWARASASPPAERNLDIQGATTPVAAPGLVVPPPSTLAPMVTPPYLIQFRCNTLKYVEATYQAQLDGQAAGLNVISCTDWLANRAALSGGRGSGVPQDEVRAEYRKTLALQGKKPPEIDDIMERLAALHEPDLVAGGFNVVGRLGSRYINSSIGSQWRTLVTPLQTLVQNLKPSPANFRINVKLKAVPFTP
jgi:hypothetical protein